MICFRDMTFCNQSSRCANETCPRHFGDNDRREAVRWWGNEDAPVAFGHMQHPTCGYVALAATASKPEGGGERDG